MSESPKKTYTVSEARRILPEIRPRLHEMQEVWAGLESYRNEAQKIGKRIEEGGATLPNAGEYFKLIQQLRENLKFFESAGIEIKDISLGLVDFLSLQGGRLVYLCWKVDEETISHWHEIQDGFAGRKPLEDTSP